MREYEFTFKNANGEDITFNEIDGEKANMFAYGESIRLADVLTVPTKEQTIQYRYEFDGWFKNENLDGEKIT